MPGITASCEMSIRLALWRIWITPEQSGATKFSDSEMYEGTFFKATKHYRNRAKAVREKKKKKKEMEWLKKRKLTKRPMTAEDVAKQIWIHVGLAGE